MGDKDSRQSEGRGRDERGAQPSIGWVSAEATAAAATQPRSRRETATLGPVARAGNAGLVADVKPWPFTLPSLSAVLLCWGVASLILISRYTMYAALRIQPLHLHAPAKVGHGTHGDLCDAPGLHCMMEATAALCTENTARNQLRTCARQGAVQQVMPCQYVYRWDAEHKLLAGMRQERHGHKAIPRREICSAARELLFVAACSA